MLNPINALQQLGLLQDLLKDHPRVQNFNGTLPLLLKVLEKKGADQYLLQLGNQVLESKSQKNLVLGKTYWALVHKSSVGATMLSNLIPQPPILAELKNAPLKLDLQELHKLLSHESKEVFKDYHEQILQHFTHAPTRQDFLFFGNLLLSLQHEVASFVITDGHKESLVQFKKGGQKERLEFYALYPHLGPLQGVLYKQDGGVCLSLGVAYESVANLLREQTGSLKGFSHIEIYTAKTLPEPLFNFEENLLDTRG
ncbi:hypothetical protein [Helicobacter heilmannii]|uniref:Uncharacterized protein n=1 Tax=Helicobacter heilmannii TaxID=35817 RepID=A0A0K2Y7G8_HELHE|nr:hypothetical protein [Helicobacter heilmannii]BDQ27361.1 hypothetical protein ASB1_10370 [Helicobacter heilmannii]CCM12304.1 hypothetical protein BN341_3000 [Helicobacter heilmannii ASB1.4]CRI34067.1 hypothetical protein HHE01_09130 [Helicobacter heilmannii]